MKALIIDDEKNARLALRGILSEHFPNIEIVGESHDIPNAVKAIHKLKPKLLFLDISMPGYSGLELLNFFDEDDVKFKIIFVTAYSEYAIKAFELSAVDYVLKPINIEDLERAIKKVIHQHQSQLSLLKDNLSHDQPKKIALSTGNGISFINLNDILFLKADGSYTHFHLIDNQKITLSKKLSEYIKLEKLGSFLRIHRSHIINCNRISKVVKNDGGYVIMEDKTELSISADKKTILYDTFKNIKL